MLFLLAQTSSAFSPTLPSAPADWTLPLTFSGGGMDHPGPLAVDSTGDVWVGSYFGVVSEFSPLGSPIFPSGITGSGLAESYGLAIDPSDNVWVTNQTSPDSINSGAGSVTVLNPAGQPLSGATGFSSGGLNFPTAVAIDPSGTAWILDFGNSHITELSSSGQPLSGPAGYTSDLFAFPTLAIALDAAHGAWIANTGSDSIIHVSPDGQQFTNVVCCNTPAGLALDGAGNVWVANYLGDSVSEITPRQHGSDQLLRHSLAQSPAGHRRRWRGPRLDRQLPWQLRHGARRPHQPPARIRPLSRTRLGPHRHRHSSPSPLPSTAAATSGSPTSPTIPSPRSSASPPPSRPLSPPCPPRPSSTSVRRTDQVSSRHMIRNRSRISR